MSSSSDRTTAAEFRSTAQLGSGKAVKSATSKWRKGDMRKSTTEPIVPGTGRSSLGFMECKYLEDLWNLEVSINQSGGEPSKIEVIEHDIHSIEDLDL